MNFEFLLDHLFCYGNMGPWEIAQILQVDKSWSECQQHIWKYIWCGILPRCGIVTMIPFQKCTEALGDLVESLLPRSCWYYPGQHKLTEYPAIIAGSYALHKKLTALPRACISDNVRRHLTCWRPNDMDVWFVNRVMVTHMAQHVALKLMDALKLKIYVCPCARGHSYANHSTTNYMELDTRGVFRCGISEVVDLKCYIDNTFVMKVSFIGTFSQQIDANKNMPLRAIEILERFDIDVCRIGYVPRGLPEATAPDFVFANQREFENAVQTGLAVQTKYNKFRCDKRLHKYQKRGFRFL